MGKRALFVIALAGCGSGGGGATPDARAPAPDAHATSPDAHALDAMPLDAMPLDAPPACPILLVPPSASFPSTGGSDQFTVTPAGCAWVATTQDTWITNVTGGGTGTGNVTYTVTANAGLARSGEIDVAGHAFAIAQDAPPCESVQLTPTGAAFSNGAHGGATFGVTASPAGCSWSATTTDAWITVDTPAGDGDGTITYDVAANTVTAAQRDGTIDVSGVPFSIMQDGATCAYTVTPMTMPVIEAGGSFSADVTASPVDCAWTPTPDSSWLHTDGVQRAGDAAFDYSVDVLAHSAPPRSGSIVIAPNVALTIIQTH